MFHFLSIGGDVFLGFGVLLKVSVGVFVFKGYRCPYIVFVLGISRGAGFAGAQPWRWLRWGLAAVLALLGRSRRAAATSHLHQWRRRHGAPHGAPHRWSPTPSMIFRW